MVKRIQPTKPRHLTIDREINDEDIWHIQVTTKSGTFNMPYRKSGLDRAFFNGAGDWNCKVLLRFINGSPVNTEKF